MLSRIGIVLVSIVLGLLGLEIGLRAMDGMLGNWSNLVLDARQVLSRTEGRRFQYDELLGFSTRAGLRPNGDSTAAAEPPVLAVGDSYTYGEEVADDETWPALLQQRIGRPVLNGGVSGYGFDQSVLRAEILTTQHHPDAVVVSFIADDIRRTEMSRIWGAEKPYFDVMGENNAKGALVLRGVPVPPRPAPASTLTFWHWLLGRSYLFDFTLRRLGLIQYWFGDHVRVHPEGMGETIACRLTDRLAELQRLSGAKVIVLAEYDPVVWDDPAFAAEQRRMTEGLLACARRQGLATLDSFEALAKSGAKPGQRALYWVWHMNAAGNGLIADLVARALDSNGK